jgi:hypothetical protein
MGSSSTSSSLDSSSSSSSSSSSTLPVSIEFISQIPADVDVFDVIGSGVNITYNITVDRNTLLNSTSVRLYYVSNSSTSTDFMFINGTTYSGFQSDNAIEKIVGINWTFYNWDNNILPATYNINVFGKNKEGINERMLTEVSKSIEVAYEIAPLLDLYGIKMEIHADINPDPKWESNKALSQAIGYILGMGYEFKVKPSAWAASYGGNKYCK